MELSVGLRLLASRIEEMKSVLTVSVFGYILFVFLTKYSLYRNIRNLWFHLCQFWDPAFLISAFGEMMCPALMLKYVKHWHPVPLFNKTLP